MKDREFKLLYDLKMIDVDLAKMKITPFTDGVKIEFPWNSFESQASKNRTITLLTADITAPNKYPEALKELIRKGFDVFYMKAAFFAPLDYPKFLPKIAKGVKNGGWLITTDLTHDMRHVDPQECLKKQGLSFAERSSDESELFKKLLSHPVDAYSSLDDRMIDKRNRAQVMTGATWSYWTILNLRQKQ